MRVFFLVAACWLVAPRVQAAAATEAQLFSAAEQVFSDADYKNAEIDFGGFIQKFPKSLRIPEAVLYQAQSRIKLGDYDGALKLLSAHQDQAGLLADWYLFCQGEALLRKGDFAQAETCFSKVIHDYPTSTHRLAAVVNAAIARSRLSQWGEVVELLGQTNGVFQLAASTNHANPDVIRGYLLLSEAQLAQNDLPSAEESLKYLGTSPLDPTNNWQRQFLLCRVLVKAARLDDALVNTTNLLVLADATGQRSIQAQTTEFQAGLLEKLNRREEALAVYQKNLGAGIPAEQQSRSLLKITQLSLELGKLEEAAQVLQSFLAQFPTNACSDLALLTLGELRLGQYQPGATTNLIVNTATNAPAATNYLQQAVTAFQSFRQSFPHSSLLGKAQLDLGWCYWLSGDFNQGQNAFRAAADMLSFPPDKAQALFKLADTEFQLTNYPAAISNYSAVVEQFGAFPEVRTNLAEAALYQVVRASQAAGDDRSETNALARIMLEYPSGSYTERAVVVAGQQLGHQFPSVARGLFFNVVQTLTNSTLLPEIQLAIARTYEEEDKWTNAIGQYDTWVATYTNHPAQERAEYSRALANYKAGAETNAFTQFTNLIARFPNSEYAPLAQWWVADYYYRLGNLLEAESNYKLVFQNYGSSALAYPARMMAGRMAVARQDWQNAPAYFRALFSDKNCPANLQAQAYFAYGDTFLLQNSTNKLNDYKDAFNVFDLICKTYPTNPIAALAWGQKAICQLQYASTSKDYSSVTNDFQAVIDSPQADASARSIAQAGLAFCLEKLAESRPEPEKSELLNAALRRYQLIFDNKGFLRDGEVPDPFWTRKAGWEEARLAISLHEVEHAIRVYRRLQQMFPALRLDERIKNLQSQL